MSFSYRRIAAALAAPLLLGCNSIFGTSGLSFGPSGFGGTGGGGAGGSASSGGGGGSAPSPPWSVRFGATQNDYIWGSAIAPNGDLVFVGSYQDKLELGTAIKLSSFGQHDMLVGALDAKGALKWAKGFGGKMRDEAVNVTVASSGHIAIAGSFTGSIDIDGKELNTNDGSAAGAVIELDENGGFGRAAWFAKGDPSVIRSAVIDSSGTLFAGGSFKGSLDNGTPSTTVEGFVRALSLDNKVLWTNVFAGGGNHNVIDLALDASGNVYVASSFSGSTSVAGMALDSKGQTDIVISRWKANGKLEWLKTYGGSGAETPRSILVDAANRVIVTGDFAGPLDFGDGGMLTSSGKQAGFLLVLSAAGVHQWSRSWSGPGNDLVQPRRVRAHGSTIYATGDFSGSVDFGAGAVASHGGNDVFLSAYDASGKHIGTRTFGDDVEQFGTALAIAADGVPTCGGFFQGTIDLGAGKLTSAGAYDGFVGRLAAP